MPSFNPTLPPEEAPNFTSFMYGARSIPEPKVDESGKTLGTGIGEAINSLAHGLDAAVKQGLDTTVHENVDKIRDQYTTALNTYKANTSGISEDEMQGAVSMKLIDPTQDTPQVPKSIQMGLQQAQNTVSGMQAGKVSSTYYYQQLTSLAKDLRAQFPGYRDYIDQKMHEITGVTPANAYVRSLIEDIDRSSQSSNAANKQIFDGLLNLAKEGMPQAGLLWKNYSSGAYGVPGSAEATSRIMDETASLNKDLYGAKVAEARLKEKAATKGATALDLEPGANQYANTLVSNALSSEITHGGVVTPQQLLQQAQDEAAGKINIPDQVWVQRGTQLQALVENLRQQMLQHYTQHDPGKQSMQDILGQDKVASIIDKALEPLKSQADFFLKGDYRMALMHANMNTAMKNDDKYQMLNDPYWGQFTRKMEYIRDTLGPGLSAKFELDQMLNPDGMKRFKALQLNAFKPDDFPAGKGSASNAIKSIVSDLPKDSQGNAIGAPENINDYMSIFKYLGNPQVPDAAKIPLAKTIFGQGNEDFLLNFKGAPSRLQMFKQVLSPENIKSIRALGDQDTWSNMRDFAEQQYSRYLFPEEIANLRDIANNPNKNPIKIAYTSDNGIPHWSVVPTKAVINPMALVGPSSTTENLYEKQVQRILDRLNQGMVPIARIAKEEKSDVDAYVLSMFHNNNIDLTSTNVAGIPQQMLAALNAYKNTGRMYRSEESQSVDSFNTRTTGKTQDRVFAK